MKTSPLNLFLLTVVVTVLGFPPVQFIRASDLRSVASGESALARGQRAMQTRRYGQAHDAFRVAADLLPNAGSTRRSHANAVRGFCESGLRLAEQAKARKRYDEAERIVREVLSDRFDPNYVPAQQFLLRLEGRNARDTTMDPRFVEKVRSVRKLLLDAEGYTDSGQYDLAFKKYEQILLLDPYNVAARRGEEYLNRIRARYAGAAYDESRSRQLWQVQKGWEEPITPSETPIGPIVDAFARNTSGTAQITRKLNSIIIPKIEFRDASVREAFDFLRQQATVCDPAAEGRKGVDIIVRTPLPGHPIESAPTVLPASLTTSAPPEASSGMATNSSVNSPSSGRITITLTEIPLGEALRYVANQAGLKVKIEPYAVLIIPFGEASGDLFTKEYRVSPDLISTSLNTGVSALSAHSLPVASATATGRDTQEATGGRQLVTREGAREFLENQGISFPTGASAHFFPSTSRLIVRNTEENLELVDALVEQANLSVPKQVEIESKFVEITQNNLKELGFDWLLGSFNIAGNSGKIVGTGGTSGTGAIVNQIDYPFPITGTNPVTAGNRTGNLAINANSIDALLFGTSSGQTLAPGIFGLAGLMTNPQFQLVIRALNQKKGVDLLSAPRVTTKSGQRAVIEIVREFRYPTQFQPPQIPQTVGSVATKSDTSVIALGGGGSVPVTPTTPTAFETRNTGVTLEVEPIVGPDGITIDLNLVPQVVEFEGFVNYGSPILSPSSSFLDTVTGGLITSPPSVITPNVINQPIFSSRKVTTNVSVWDGQTVVLGGLMREDVQKTQDRTPLIGDIPIVGRLFRSNAEQHIKRNLIIFVTARLVNPGGRALRQTDEEGQIEPPILPEVPMSKK